MMKLILAISDDDPALQKDGILADKTWLVDDHIAITVKSGFTEETANGFRIARFGPRLSVHARNDHWQRPPDFRKDFDLVAFENALREAKAHIAEVEEYIMSTTKKLWWEVQIK